jgi:hypothetical protein
MKRYKSWRACLQKGQEATDFLGSVCSVASDRYSSKQSINLHYIRKMAVGIGAVAAVFFGMHHSAQALGPQQYFMTATQSSQHGSYTPESVIDGNLSTFNHTKNEDGEWWVGDLGRLVNIEQISVHNRGSCCQSRLNSRVYVFINDPRPLIEGQPFNEVMDILDKMREPYSNSANGASGGPLFNFNPSSGDVGPARYVMLIQQNSDYLHLDEVIVYGEAFTRGKGAGGQSFRFNDSAARLTIGNDKEVDLGEHWSLSARFNDLDAGGWRTLFRGKGGDHQIILDSSGMLGTYCSTSSCKQGQSGSFFSTGFDMDMFDDGQTHTITAIGSGDTTTFYVDGIEVGSVPVKSESDIYAIGNYQGGGQLFALLVDDIQIHRVALRPQEIARIAKSDVITRGLVSHFDGDGNTGSESLIDDAFSSRVLTSAGNVTAWTMPAIYTDELYIDDTLPMGASIHGDELIGGSWPWNIYDTISSTTIVPTNGYYFHNYGGNTGGSIQQHYVQGLNYTVKRDDVFSTWVKPFANYLPSGIQIQINSNGWKRVHWGQVPYSPSKQMNGQAPSNNDWVNLEVALEDFGIKEGDPITGIAFTHRGGIAGWDNTHIGGGYHAQGFVSIEKWNNVSGTTLQDLFDDDRYPYSPDETVSHTSAEMYAPNVGSNHAIKISGFITPPTSGNYTFWIASDDQGVLRLSNNAQPGNVTDAAFVPSWTTHRQWNKFPEQQSTSRYLLAGHRYYFEALAKEGSGGDNLSIAWQGPGISQQVISSQYLSLPADRHEVWRQCAVNPGSPNVCGLPPGAIGTVRFGAYGAYEYVYNVDGVLCVPSEFGGVDPLPGKAKQCDYRITGSKDEFHGGLVHGEAINFHSYTTRGYGGSQDNPNTGIALVEDDGATLHMIGNRWQQIDLHDPYQVTADTYLEFDFTSTVQGEVQGIGFDNNDGLSSGNFFQVYGTQNWGNQSFHNYSSGTKHYKIKVGDYFTGSFSQMFFAGDDDSSATYGNSKFSNVELYEEHQGATKHKLSSETADVYFEKGDVLEGPDGYYAVMDDEGNLRVTNGSTVYWKSQTSQSELQQQTVRQSAFHASCDTSEVDGCLPGYMFVVADDGVRVVDENGHIVWRPDLGDLSRSTEGLSARVKVLESSHGTNHPSLVIIDNKTNRHIWDSHYGYHPRLQSHAEALVTPTNYISERFFKKPPMGNVSVYRTGFQTYSAVSYGNQVFASNPDGVVGSPFRYISEQDAARGEDYVSNDKLDKGILKNLKGKIDYLYSEIVVESGNKVVYRAHVTNDGRLKIERGVMENNHHANYLSHLGAGLGHSTAVHTAYTEEGAPYTDVSTSGAAGANGDYYLIMTPKGFEVRNAETHDVHWDKDVSLRAPGGGAVTKDPSAGIGSYMLTINHTNGRIELHQSDYTAVFEYQGTLAVHDPAYPSSALAWHSDISWGSAITSFSQSAELAVANFIVSKFERLFGDLQTLGTDVIADTRALIDDIRQIPGDSEDHKVVNLSALLAAYNDLGQLTDDLVEDGLDVAIDVADIAVMMAAVIAPEFVIPIELAEEGFVVARSAISVVHAIHDAHELLKEVNTTEDLLDGVTEQILKDEYGDDYERTLLEVGYGDNIDTVNMFGEHTESSEHHGNGWYHRERLQVSQGLPATNPNPLQQEFDDWGNDCKRVCQFLTETPVLTLDFAFDKVFNQLTGNAGYGKTGWRNVFNTNKRLSHFTIRPLFRLQPRLINFSGDANAERVKNRFSFALKFQFISSRLGLGSAGNRVKLQFVSAGLIDSSDFIFHRRAFQQRKPGSTRDDRTNATDFVSYGGGVAWWDPTLPNAANYLTQGSTIIGTFIGATFNDSSSGNPEVPQEDDYDITDEEFNSAVIPALSGIVTGLFQNASSENGLTDIELLAGAGTLTKHRLSDLDTKEKGYVMLAHYGAPAFLAYILAGTGVNNALSNWSDNYLAPDVLMYAEFITGTILGNMAGIYATRYYNTDGTTVLHGHESHSNFKGSTLGGAFISYMAVLTTPGMFNSKRVYNSGSYLDPHDFNQNYTHITLNRLRQRTQLTFAVVKNFVGPAAALNWVFGEDSD